MKQRRLSARVRIVLRVFAVFAVGVAIVPGLSASSRSAVQSRASAPVLEAPDEATAMAAAYAQGSKVEVARLRTPTRAVYANPDGTMTGEVSVVPTRVERDGRWVPVDTSIVSRPDGLGPRAALGDLALSTGGADLPLARLTRDGTSFALFWTGALPAPTVDGSAVTYPEVLPGVDLVMHAESNGYRQHLVVKTADAARNPALARIRLPFRADGLRLEADQTGAVRALDAKGEQVFAASPSTMWDASGGGAGRSAPVGVTVLDGSLVLRPDLGFLADPAVVFPVTIDPNMHTPDKSNWATVLSGKSTTKYWWTSGEPPWAQVGQCFRANPDHCNNIGEAWAYFQFDTSFAAGKRILSAQLKSVVVHSPDCSTRTHQLFVVPGGQIWPEMNWTNRLQGGLQAEVGVPDACGGPKPVGFGLPLHQHPTPPDGIGGITSWFLKAKDSNDQLAWRKYDPAQTRMEVRFNTTPNKPDQVTTDPPLASPCRWCGNVSYFGDRSIRLRARLSDPDGDQVRPKWRVAVNGTEVASFDGAYQTSGFTHDTTVNLSDKNGTTVGSWLHAEDNINTDPNTPPFGDVSDAVPGPLFVVDLDAPRRGPTVRGVLYQPDNRWHGGVGLPDTFTFAANPEAGEANDIDHYLYGWTSPPATSVVATTRLGDSANVALTPPGDGPRTLFVQSVDRAGHLSPTTEYRFYVRAGNGALAQWSFEGNANDTAFLGDRNGTLNGSTTYGPGAVGSSLQLNAQPGAYVTAPNTVRTDVSYTISAWVKPSRLPDSGVAAIACQEEAQYCGFYLNYRPDIHQTTFQVDNRINPAAPANYWAVGPAPQPDTWTHLAGVYDQSANKIRLFVNGELANETALPANYVPWNTTGPVQIGREKWNGTYTDPWFGSIDEVQLYDRALSEAEIRAAVGRSNVQVANWRMDDETGATARNTVDSGPMAVLQGGAAFTGDGATNGAVRLNGTDGYLATSGPVVRTDQSFSVAAWVKPNLLPEGQVMGVVSQHGNRPSAFYLNYRGDTHHTTFMLASADQDNPNGYWAEGPPLQKDVWTHLAGVYDRPANRIHLYVNGDSVADVALPANFVPWNAAGPLEIGREKWNGAFGNPWNGSIDEVRVYSRAISGDEVRGIVGADGVTAGQWKLDGNANDSSGRNLTGTLGGTPEWSAGQTTSPDPSDLAVKLDGATTYVTAPHALDTSNSFSVSAWVRLDRAGNGANVVSQDGAHSSGFMLRALADGRWAFAAPWTDTVNPSGDNAESTAAAVQVGVWTHLVAVYSKDRQRMELYVNGVLAASSTHATAFNATGSLQIGRVRWNDAYIGYFPGVIDDVTVYSRVLFADEIRTMAGRDLSLVHNWQLDESSGTNSADAVGVRAGTLRGGASFEPGRTGNAVRLDGVDDAVSTTGVDVRTDQSFTVAGWVYLTGNPCDLSVVDRCVVDAVSVDGPSFSKFRLGHVVDSDQAPRGKWTFEMPELDTGSGQAALSVEPGELNSWVHLVGVYDAPTQKIWLYVNGDRIADGTLHTPWQATGGVQIGRGKAAGQAAEYWPGSVDDVRLYTGAQDKDRIRTLYRSYPAPAAPPALPVADAGFWKFNEGTGTSAADSSGNGRHATLRGGATWGSARSSWGLNLDGTTGYADTAATVVDPARNFSVSAWAYPTAAGGLRTVLAQDGNQMSTFALQYRPSDSRWVVRVPTADALNASVTVRLTSTEPVVSGQWMHLAVTYDAGQQIMRLYVNGGLSAVQRDVILPSTTGPLTVGRSLLNHANAEYFGGLLDDVRAFGRVVTDAEVHKIYDDVYLSLHGYWRFDGNGTDTSWRQNPTTLSGTPSYVQGVNDRALQLDGTSVAAKAQSVGVPMIGSFTVSAWAKLGRTDRVQTVLGEDGVRMSGYVLQYRPEYNRWVFGAPAQDTDGAALIFAASAQPPVANIWTQLTGVYDYPSRQLRLYVDGQLAGNRSNVLLWPAWGGFTIGRDKLNGNPADFFAGALDEVTTDMGAASDAEIARRAAYPEPAGGQFGRFVNARGDHSTARTGTPAAAGYHFEATLGGALPPDATNTRMLYACLLNADAFTSVDPNCENQVKVGEIGLVYAAQPASPPTIPIYRCNSGPDHFESIDSTCGGNGAIQESVLGYTIGYAALSRNNNPVGWEHSSTINGAPAGYYREGTLGFVSLTGVAGGLELFSCRDGIDMYTSVDVTCEGKTKVASLGWIWPQPPDGLPSVPLYRCRIGGDRFDSRMDSCENQTMDRTLGYVLISVPSSDQHIDDIPVTRTEPAGPVAGNRPPFDGLPA